MYSVGKELVFENSLLLEINTMVRIRTRIGIRFTERLVGNCSYR